MIMVLNTIWTIMLCVASFAVGMTVGMIVNMNIPRQFKCRWCSDAHDAQDHDGLIREYGE